jgi:hypothetical protein
MLRPTVVAMSAILAACGTPRPVPAPAQAGTAASTAAPAESPFVPLFNGTDLAGWTGDTAGYLVEGGAIACGPKGTNLYTEREYSNFVLRLSFRLAPGANNGIGIRAPLVGDAAYVGMEIQVLDDGGSEYTKLLPGQYHGSIYKVAPAKRGFQKPVGEWNSEEIVANGRQITVKLNGTTIVDANLDDVTDEATLKEHRDLSKPDGSQGIANTKGHIGFLGHGAHVEFRNIRIKVL